MTLTNQNYFRKTEAQLRFIMRDAAEAADLVRNFDSAAEAKYMEQVYDAGTVLNQLSKKAA